MHLFHSVASGVLGGNRLNTDDLDGVSPGTVASSHITVALGHGSADCQVAVITVHVVGSGPRVAYKPDAKVLDCEWLAFDDGLNADNLSVSLLELTESLTYCCFFCF